MYVITCERGNLNMIYSVINVKNYEMQMLGN